MSRPKGQACNLVFARMCVCMQDYQVAHVQNCDRASNVLTNSLLTYPHSLANHTFGDCGLRLHVHLSICVQ